MNLKQRRVLIGVAVVTLLMLLFPPFQQEFPSMTVSRGYDFIAGGGSYRINLGLLLIQWLGVWVVGGIATFLVADKSEGSE